MICFEDAVRASDSHHHVQLTTFPQSQRLAARSTVRGAPVLGRLRCGADTRIYVCRRLRRQRKSQATSLLIKRHRAGF